MIHRRYQFRRNSVSYFNWLVAELDPATNTAFGYANLDDDEMAEWGYINIQELIENGADLDRSWEPCTYREALKRIEIEKEERLRMFDERWGLRYFGKAKNPKLDDFR
ncbi:MAG: hypothetical protein JRM94_04675 [Nitrososphaerota archaeon]|nr:hypothetical protein [Nitrososphaerota archaeon]